MIRPDLVRDAIEFDRSGVEYGAALAEGALLYRVASLNSAQRDRLFQVWLPGGKGRFHVEQQPTIYCATNVLLACTEVLYHQYRRVIAGIVKRMPVPDIRQHLVANRRLVVFRVRELGELVYADARSARADFGSRVGGTGVVFPDTTYLPLQEFGTKLRGAKKNGVLYPSARHSEGLAVAFFGDVSSSLLDDDYHILDVRLSLIEEDQDFSRVPRPIGDVYTVKLHQAVGHYSVVGPDGLWDRLNSEGLLSPEGLPEEGYVDFVRRPYGSYPADAVLTA